MTEEEIQALQTELESTRTELESVKAEKDTLASDLEAKAASITELEHIVATRDSDIVTLKEGMVESNENFTSLQSSLSQAVSAYKTALSQANPSVPGELIVGDTIEAIDQSLESANTLVARVRTTIEAEIAAGKVPAGAPARTPPDLSALSPREKIQLALAKGQG
jgi:chromosome segregation ATPase